MLNDTSDLYVRHEAGEGNGPIILSEAIRVLVADDHPPARLGVRMALEASGGFEVCAEAKDATEAIDFALEHHPRVCLLDVRMPGGGIEAASRISHLLPDTDVVMLTMSREEQDLFAALEAGASGYLLKDTDPERLPEALKGVLRGEAAIPRHLVTRLVGEFQGRDHHHASPAGSESPQLTEREWEVLESMRQGLSTAEIAEKLFVTQVTVRTHIASTLRKLQVPDRLSAVRLNVRRP